MMAHNPLHLKFHEETQTSTCAKSCLLPSHMISPKILKLGIVSIEKSHLVTRTRATVAREVSVLDTNYLKKKKGLEMKPAALWNWYLDWLYHHEELKLYIDVS